MEIENLQVNGKTVLFTGTEEAIRKLKEILAAISNKYDIRLSKDINRAGRFAIPGIGAVKIIYISENFYSVIEGHPED